MTNLARLRFAPSPNGALHLGHAYSALFAWEMAKVLNGQFLLRIEDIDVQRSRTVFEKQIFEDLEWLDLTWETPVRRQSEHFDTYKQASEKLLQMNLLYPCFATRKQISENVGNTNSRDPDGMHIYPGIYKTLDPEEARSRIATGEKYCLRIHMDRAQAQALRISRGPLSYRQLDPESGQTKDKPINPSRWGDTVIARKDVPTSYHLSVVVDDALQGITHVTRGQDLEAATDIHRLLQILLDLPSPLYHHHKLIRDDQLQKLSKRDKA
ncbi:MAG: tRNA glutamyl-Q(34) synthetase GluQRS, partial [Methyloligellaceae bacterium]